MTPNPKRIPKGTRVKWRARYPSDPLHEGVVLAFVDRGARWPLSAHRAITRNTGAPVYVVRCSPAGRTAKIMTPYASRLEAQNPEAMEK